MNTELCPFCGGKAITENVSETPKANGPPKMGFTFIPQVTISCETCATTSGEFEGEGAQAEAIAAWNRRFVCLDKNGDKVYARDSVMLKTCTGYYNGIVTWRAAHADWVVLYGSDSIGWGIRSDNIELIKEGKE